VGPTVGSTADPDARADRHRALSDKSRLALLRVLEASSRPLGVPELAERVGLHANTVRWHLGVLVAAGLATEQRSSASGRGRPSHSYVLVPGALDDRPGGYRLLAEVLAEALELGRGDAGEAVEEAGRRRGRMLVQPRLGDRGITAKDATAEIVRLLEVFGFQPRAQREPGGQRIAMRPCPFGETAANHAAIVCPAHLGLMRGALETLQAPLEATRLEPYARPDLCVAHLEPRVRGGAADRPSAPRPAASDPPRSR
jgi:predicted ArsR family transcriptional regulator